MEDPTAFFLGILGIVFIGWITWQIWKAQEGNKRDNSNDTKNGTIRSIRFFCKNCGKEIWEDMNYNEETDTPLGDFLETCECSDCGLKKVQAEITKKRL